MGSPIEIRPAVAADREGWLPLYRGYATFYKRKLTAAQASTVWSWLMDPAHELEGLVAEAPGGLVGLIHFRRMPSPLDACDIGFADDLFVSPEARGGKVGQRLLLAVGAIARERGWPYVQWITADDNYRGRTVYDRIATRTPWVTYEMTTAGKAAGG